MKPFLQFFKVLSNRFNNIQLRNKLLISFGSLIVLSVNMVGFLSYFNIQKSIYDQTRQSYSQNLNQIINNIEYKINEYDELFNHLSIDSNLLSALSKKYSDPSDYSFEYLNTISQALDSKKNFNAIDDLIIYKFNDTLPDSGQELISVKNVETTWWYRKYFANYAHFNINDYIRLSKLKLWLVEQHQGRKSVSIVKPMMNNYEQLVALLEIRINYNNIFSEFINQVSSLSDGEAIYIVDNDGRLIFDSQHSSSDKAPLIAEMQQMINKGVKDSRILHMSGKNLLLLYEKGTQTDWNYFREVPMNNLLLEARKVRLYTIEVSALSIVICFLIAFAFSEILHRRIRFLSVKMEQVDDLTLGEVIEFQGRDEIGQLSHSYNRMLRRIRELVDQLKFSQQQQKESELKVLQAQINPHFLYNTLATINWMAVDGEKEKIIAMVENLAVFYRLSLNKGRETLTLRDELKQAESYIEIQKIRLGQKIIVTKEIESELFDCIVLKIILQPFIENAILHGAEYKEELTHIRLRVYSHGIDIVMEVIDDGVGMEFVPDFTKPMKDSGGFGIRNVHERIRLYYGSPYGVTMESKPGAGTTVRITIPKITDATT